MTNKLGLYFHFPFCEKKCFYCDFYSLTKKELSSEYINALLRHIEEKKDEAHGRTVDTIYIGGGTPSLMSGDEAKLLFEKIFECFEVSSDCEITLEVNPKTADLSKLKAFREAGVNRLSIGMQSANDEELEKLGRIHNFSDVEKTVCDAKQAGFNNIGVDLIYGLPNQSIASWESTLNKAVALDVDHISFYAITIEEGTPFYKMELELPTDEEQEKMYFAALDVLSSNGFVQYEISNASKNGKESRHNKKYWNLEEYLGFGASAHSFFNGKRFFVIGDLKKYIKTHSFEKLIIEETQRPHDRIFEYIMLSLRTSEGISYEKLSQYCDLNYIEEMKEKLPSMYDNGYIEYTEQGFRLTSRGYFISNLIITQLM